MDGVSYASDEGIQKCGNISLSFTLKDALTHWYRISQDVCGERLYDFLTFAALGGGAVGAVVAAPVVLGVVGALGFTSGGIAACSYAAGMMSTAAVANGGAVAAGSTVALLQAVGAAGLSGTATAAVAGAGAGVGAGVGATVGWLAAIII
ncbi:hypothetical protein FQN60_009085 [Etheostoma spectabile]|uniref:Interferon alpha-inducible protein 27-like protein 2A n=1 Tax=Etheostoma spectabile TaxID=54343 RepID=A0A5J5CNL0_9PERO|nr:hypothetical protein FQN60_009085 [Etheostoma spectabile]